jgi:imidazolonepropionase-like amidohydrolase
VTAPPGQILADAALLAQVDPAKVKAIAARTAALSIWNGPTLAFFELLTSDEPSAVVAAHPEMRYVHPKAIAQSTTQREQLRAEFPPDGRQAFIQVREELVRALHQAGAKLLVGSDSPQTFMAPGFGALMEVEALARAGVPAYSALLAATRNPAELLGRADVGTVAVGQRADLVLLDANPLANVRNLRQLSGVMLAGRWVPRPELTALLDGVAAQYAAAK